MTHMHGTTIFYKYIAVGCAGLLVVCGLWATSVSSYVETDANEDVQVTPVNEVVVENVEERRMMRDAQREEREEMRLQTQEGREMMQERGATPEEMRMYDVVDPQKDARMLFVQQRQEMIAERLQVRSEIHGAIADRREALRATVQERREVREVQAGERKARFAEATQKNLQMRAGSIATGMERALDKLNALVGRVEVRMMHFSEQGADISSAMIVFNGSEERQGVRALMDSAIEDVAELRALMEEAIKDEDPKAHMETIRESASLAKESIRLVHMALRDTVVELKATTASVATGVAE